MAGIVRLNSTDLCLLASIVAADCHNFALKNSVEFAKFSEARQAAKESAAPSTRRISRKNKLAPHNMKRYKKQR